MKQVFVKFGNQNAEVQDQFDNEWKDFKKLEAKIKTLEQTI